MGHLDVLTDRFASAMQCFRHILPECHLLAYVQVRLAASHLPVQAFALDALHGSSTDFHSSVTRTKRSLTEVEVV